MATKFRSDSNQAQSPPWCKKAVFPPSIALVDGNPSRLVCFAYWLDLNAEPLINISEAFSIQYQEDTDDWYGASSSSGLRLVVHVTKELPNLTYTIELQVWRGTVMLDDDSWHEVSADVLPYFNSRELSHVHDAGIDQNGIHATA